MDFESPQPPGGHSFSISRNCWASQGVVFSSGQAKEYQNSVVNLKYCHVPSTLSVSLSRVSKANLDLSTNDISNHQPLTYPTMAERELQDIQRKLKSSRSYNEQLPLLSSAKLALLKLKSLTPLPNTPSSTLSLARDIFETGALLSIRAKDPAAFTRYVHQLTPFYELPDERLAPSAEKNKITGLYLLLLLTQGDYAGFHTELEGLELRGGLPGGNNVENDRFLGYPIKLERWLQEGSFDLVWKAMASREVPSEEYGVFSEVCIPSQSSPSNDPRLLFQCLESLSDTRLQIYKFERKTDHFFNTDPHDAHPH